MISKPYINLNNSLRTLEGGFAFHNIFLKRGVKLEDIIEVTGHFSWWDENIEEHLNNLRNSNLIRDTFDDSKFDNWMRKGLRHVIIYNMLTKDYFTAREGIKINTNLTRTMKEDILDEHQALINGFSLCSNSYRMMGHTHLIKDFMHDDDKTEIILDISAFLIDVLGEDVLPKYNQLIADLFILDDLFDSYEIYQH